MMVNVQTLFSLPSASSRNINILYIADEAK